MVSYESLFQSFFLGGFECSTHRLPAGKRLDMVAASRHSEFVREDYLRLQEVGMRTAREGIRWHLIENKPGHYDFSSVAPMVRAADETGTQIIWDLFHYGYPDWLDIFSPRFVDSFAALARAFAHLVKSETGKILFVSPINEISFFSWAAGETGYMNPFAKNRGNELKEQLVRASISATEAIWEIDPTARITQIDPVINVLPEDEQDEKQRHAAEAYRLSQYEAWDRLAGEFKPELGGARKYLDIIGVNYYVHNQWILGGSFIEQRNPRYKPFREILCEVSERYQRPIFIAETGIEDELRPSWFRYVCDEAKAAISGGVQLEGICLYPILNHPGWDDERHCHNGLWDYADAEGEREIYGPLAAELARQQIEFARLLNAEKDFG